jgi:hypothetical protein
MAYGLIIAYTSPLDGKYFFVLRFACQPISGKSFPARDNDPFWHVLTCWLLMFYFLASRWKILYQQRDQRNEEKKIERDADSRLPLKAGQAVGAGGSLL